MFLLMKRIIRVLMNVIYRLDIFHQMLKKLTRSNLDFD